MEQKDKDILKSINGFVLYCKGFYKHTDFMYKDLKILLSDNYTINSEKDIFFIILNRWNQWNEKLPQEERMTVSKNRWKQIRFGLRLYAKYFCDLWW